VSPQAGTRTSSEVARVAVVTRSRRLSAATARQLACGGARVSVVDVDDSAARSFAAADPATPAPISAFHQHAVSPSDARRA